MKENVLLRNVLEDFGTCSKATVACVEWTTQASFFKCLDDDFNSEYFQVDSFGCEIKIGQETLLQSTDSNLQNEILQVYKLKHFKKITFKVKHCSCLVH